jgi:hypothetical protein
MSKQCTVTRSWANGDGGSVNSSKTYTASAQLSIDESVPDSSTDLQVACDVDISEIEALILHSDQALTVEANSGAGSGGSVTLSADVPYIWTTDSPESLVFTADLTDLYLTNSSGSAARFRLECIYDPTP